MRKERECCQEYIFLYKRIDGENIAKFSIRYKKSGQVFCFAPNAWIAGNAVAYPSDAQLALSSRKPENFRLAPLSLAVRHSSFHCAQQRIDVGSRRETL